MKKLILLSVVGLMSTGVFANENSKNKNNLIEKSKKEIEAKNKKAVKAQITVNCSDGSSWIISCDGCSTAQLIGIAWALCS